MPVANVNMKYVLFLAFVAALGGFLFGYDTAVISGTISSVTQQFGLGTIESGWYVGCALVGSILGAMSGGVLSDKLGRRHTLFIAAILFCVSPIGCVVSSSFTFLVFVLIIGGAAIGVVSILSPLYISEISVPQFRGQLVALYQLAITIGFLGAYLVNFGLQNFSETGAVELSSSLLKLIFHDEVWRAMLGMAIIPATLFFTIIFFIPKSPRWLMLKEKHKAASTVLERIFGSSAVALNEINAIKKGTSGGKANWRIIFKPCIRKAILIGTVIAMPGQFISVNAVFNTKIIFVESPIFPQTVYDLAIRKVVIKKNEALHMEYDKLFANDKNFLLFLSTNMIGSDNKATVDGIHFTDLGFIRFAKLLYPTLKKQIAQ